MWEDPFGTFCSVKYLNFCQKLPIRTARYTSLGRRHPEVTKNPYYVLNPEGSQKSYQLIDYMLHKELIKRRKGLA